MTNTTCETCAHKKVCMYKGKANELNKKLPEPEGIFIYLVHCEQYGFEM